MWSHQMSLPVEAILRPVPSPPIYFLGGEIGQSQTVSATDLMAPSLHEQAAHLGVEGSASFPALRAYEPAYSLPSTVKALPEG